MVLRVLRPTHGGHTDTRIQVRSRAGRIDHTTGIVWPIRPVAYRLMPKQATALNASTANVKSVEDVRLLPTRLSGLSGAMEAQRAECKKFLY